MKIYNTLTRKKQTFKSLMIGEVRMYVCGVTPYSEAHIGHAMSYINFDVVRRYLVYKGYKVRYIQNVTDIDDKIIDKANREGKTAEQIAEKYTQSFNEDMEALNVIPADITPRATDEIDRIIGIVKGLEDNDFAYQSGGSVYFRVRKMTSYGKLSRQKLSRIRAGARIEPGEEKEDPMDFVLWKASKPSEPSWDSPWGLGRPGWHIECSAMSMKYLGDTLDIHGGGRDLVFPHHENEIAQSECFTGKPYTRYWMHNGLLQLGEEKMSKSLGNIITIKEALSKYSADAIRLFILSSHYRSPLKFSEEALRAAEGGVERLARVIDKKATEAVETIDIRAYRLRFTKVMDDDFNAPQALGVLFDLAREINQAADEDKGFGEGKELLNELARDIFGLKLTAVAESTVPPELKILVNEMIRERNKYRRQKKWQKADGVRNKLRNMGVMLEDTLEGTKAIWKRSSK